MSFLEAPPLAVPFSSLEIQSTPLSLSVLHTIYTHTHLHTQTHTHTNAHTLSLCLCFCAFRSLHAAVMLQYICLDVSHCLRFFFLVPLFVPIVTFSYCLCR